MSEKKIQNSNRDLWLIYVKLRSKAKADGSTVFGKRLATSGKKMILCPKSSIYDDMSEKQHLFAENIFGFAFVAPNFEIRLFKFSIGHTIIIFYEFIALIPLYTSVKVLFVFSRFSFSIARFAPVTICGCH